VFKISSRFVGKDTVKDEPLPTLLSTVMVPRCANRGDSTIILVNCDAPLELVVDDRERILQALVDVRALELGLVESREAPQTAQGQ